MLNKGILSFVTVGLLTSPLTGVTVKAEVNGYEFLKKSIEHHAEKPLQTGFVDLHSFNNIRNNLKNTPFYSSKTNSFNQKDSINRTNFNTEEEELFETETNDKFELADDLPFNTLMVGQSLPLYDLDLHKIVVPTDGIIYVAGTTNSYAIDLVFGVFQKDFVENDRLIYLGSEYDDEYGIEYQAYQAKAGTYYVAVADADNDYNDDNTEEDLYAIYAEFEDNVAPNKPAVYKVDNNDIVVTGKAEAYSKVTVKKGTDVIGTGKASSTGTFSVSIPVTKANSTLSITAKDSSGNESAATSVVVADVIAPAKPAVNRVDNNDIKVSGYAEVNSTVIVKKGTKVLGTAKASSTRYFNITIPVQPAGTILSVSAKDAAGNVSSSVIVTVADVIPPSKPTINRVDDNDLKVTGKAEKYSTVRVRRGTTLLGTATADGYGNYSVKIAAQSSGTVISVNARDKSGNTSQSATYTVVRH